MYKYFLKESGVTVKTVQRESPFFLSGLRTGDRIVSINGIRIGNELDFFFYASDDCLRLKIIRKSKNLFLKVKRSEGSTTGVSFVEKPIKRCSNRCIFCFVDQMPPGLRRSLYIKDEDIRLSLLNGNYITMSAFNKDDLRHIIRLGLSPLYVSVHTTDNKLRRLMLGNNKAPDIMEQLNFLGRHGICFHTQIVVCPTYNDGKHLEQSVNDLLRLGDSLLSVAVVPVGLTRFRKNTIPPIDFNSAAEICKKIGTLSDRAKKSDGVRKIFLADEFFIKANLPIPESSYYEDYPQTENGVGLIRQLMDSWKKLKRKLIKKSKKPEIQKIKKSILVTSVSAFPYLYGIIEEMNDILHISSLKVIPVVNRFFGESVTVAGLLTASDIIGRIKREAPGFPAEEIIIPAVVFNNAGFTIDGYSASRMAERIGIPVRVVNSIGGVLDG